MTTPIQSPFSVRADDQAPAPTGQPQYQDPQAAMANTVFATFRYEMMLSLVKGQLAKIGTVIESGIQEEDLSINEDGSFDVEFDAATVEALEEIEAETRKLLQTVVKFKHFVSTRPKGE